MASVRAQYEQVASELEIKTHKLTLLQEQHQQSEVQQVPYSPSKTGRQRKRTQPAVAAYAAYACLRTTALRNSSLHNPEVTDGSFVHVGAWMQLASEVEAMQKDLESARQGVQAATQKEKDLKAKATQLEKDIERMGREKGQRLKQLEAKCKQAKKEAVAAAKALEVRRKKAEECNGRRTSSHHCGTFTVPHSLLCNIQAAIRQSQQ